MDLTELNLVDKYYDRCFVTNRILYEDAAINYIYREKPIEKGDDRDYVDTGWRFLSGDESEDYMEKTENISLVSLGAVLTRDDSFVDILDSEIGASFVRNKNGIFEKNEFF